ncbi:hypothetical protein M231_07202 [Tremella mesenterica]|uniref:Nudix hydrolase domain-containing protein n=1 Tax=Tremella mesenterica TaxID=5217 RepID=A0A4Q1BFX4_TREME|nr:hypothetical protein M231_07202 [Tremella mesenterica]
MTNPETITTDAYPSTVCPPVPEFKTEVLKATNWMELMRITYKDDNDNPVDYDFLKHCTDVVPNIALALAFLHPKEDSSGRAKDVSRPNPVMETTREETSDTVHTSCLNVGYEPVKDTVRPSLGNTLVVLVEQLRPATGTWAVGGVYALGCFADHQELPGGMVGSTESAQVAALRELAEETGYSSDRPGGGTVISTQVSPPLQRNPGAMNESLQVTEINIEVDSNKLPESRPDKGEVVRRVVVPLSELRSTLQDYETRGFAVDSGLWFFARGMEVAISLGGA